MLANIPGTLIERYAVPWAPGSLAPGWNEEEPPEGPAIVTRTRSRNAMDCPLAVQLFGPDSNASVRPREAAAETAWPSSSGDTAVGSADYATLLCREIEARAPAEGSQRKLGELYVDRSFADSLDEASLRCVLHAVEQAWPGQAREDPRRVIATAQDSGFGARLALWGELDFRQIEIHLPIARLGQGSSPSLDRFLHDVTAARHHRIEGVRVVVCGQPSDPIHLEALDRLISVRPDQIIVPIGAAVLRARHDPADAVSVAAVTYVADRLVCDGYVHLGLGWFALPDDGLRVGFAQGNIRWGPRGFATEAVADLAGFGCGAASRSGALIARNEIRLSRYQRSLQESGTAFARLRRLSAEDQIRADVMERILCGREVRYGWFLSRHGVDFRTHFRTELARLAGAERDGLLVRDRDCLRLHDRARYFLPALLRVFGCRGDAGLIFRIAAGSAAVDPCQCSDRPAAA